MLRISEGAIDSGVATLVLEGSVAGPWIRELQRACDEFLSRGYRLALDLTDVSFVDREAVAVFRDLAARRTMLLNCPLFLTEQLKASVIPARPQGAE